MHHAMRCPSAGSAGSCDGMEKDTSTPPPIVTDSIAGMPTAAAYCAPAIDSSTSLVLAYSSLKYDDSLVGPPQPTLPPGVDTGAYLVFYELMPRAADGDPDGRNASTDQYTGDPSHAPVIVVDPPPGAPAEIADRSDANAPSGPAPATSGDEGDEAGSGRDGSDGGAVEGDDPMETD